MEFRIVNSSENETRAPATIIDKEQGSGSSNQNEEKQAGRFRRPSPDVSQADGPNPSAHEKRGNRNFKTDRKGRKICPENPQPVCFHLRLPPLNRGVPDRGGARASIRSSSIKIFRAKIATSRACPNSLSQIRSARDQSAETIHQLGKAKVSEREAIGKDVEKQRLKLTKLCQRLHFKFQITEELSAHCTKILGTITCLQKKLAKKPGSRRFANELRAVEKTCWMKADAFRVTHQELKEWQSQALKAKTEMIEANLRLVISIAKKIHQSRAVISRPDPGREYGTDESSREIRVQTRLQIFHLRYLVDTPGNHPVGC